MSTFSSAESRKKKRHRTADPSGNPVPLLLNGEANPVATIGEYRL
jgi:hypothetical protein